MLPDAFAAKTLTPATPCIVWTGALNSRGYPCFSVEGWSQLAHRLAYEDAFGPIPEGLTVDHTCKVKRCVNPDHLEAVTRAENVRRSRRPDMCPEGHQYTPENTIRRTNKQTGHTQRECRICKAESQRKYRARKNAEAAS